MLLCALSKYIRNKNYLLRYLFPLLLSFWDTYDSYCFSVLKSPDWLFLSSGSSGGGGFTTDLLQACGGSARALHTCTGSCQGSSDLWALRRHHKQESCGEALPNTKFLTVAASGAFTNTFASATAASPPPPRLQTRASDERFPRWVF